MTIEVFEGDVTIVGLGKALECLYDPIYLYHTARRCLSTPRRATCQIQIHYGTLRTKTSASPIMEDLAEELYHARKCHPHPYQAASLDSPSRRLVASDSVVQEDSEVSILPQTTQNRCP
jgi:hypothetical protein